MKTKSTVLIDELQSEVRKLVLFAEKLKAEPAIKLETAPAPGKWSVAQVLAHLNSYGRFYIPAMTDAIEKNSESATEIFKAGWFGDYFTRLMLPKTDGSIGKKMQSPKDHRPVAGIKSQEALEEFIEQQHQILDLLQRARQRNIGRIRVPISISKLIKLKLGDTFRFVVAHERRHFQQIKNVLAEITLA